MLSQLYHEESQSPAQPMPICHAGSLCHPIKTRYALIGAYSSDPKPHQSPRRATAANATTVGAGTGGGGGGGVSDLHLLRDGPTDDDGEGDVDDSSGTIVWGGSSSVSSVSKG
ncbi:hypothetical protein Tco_1130468 [Tanacetum coccineum]